MRALVWLCALLVGLVPILTGAASRADRGYTARYGLELDGVFVGWLDSFEGGNAVGEVVAEGLGGDLLAKKHIGNVKYEEVTMAFGTGMSKALYEWIDTGFTGKAQRKNGAIIAADYDLKERSRLEFTGALITEIGMPALDASSKDAAKMKIKFQPEYTRRKAGSGQPLKGSISVKQKQWLPSNFRLKIDGLDDAASRVNKIEALTIKQKVTSDAIGESRDYEQEPTSLEVPNLVFTTSELAADVLVDYHQDFVINGNNGQEREKGGTLEYLAADGKTVLFSLTFKNLGIFKLAPDKVEAGSEQIRRVKAEMYCEDIRFSYTSAATN